MPYKGGNDITSDGMQCLSKGNLKNIKVLDLCSFTTYIVINGLGN
jgi:hypothetical protein